MGARLTPQRQAERPEAMGELVRSRTRRHGLASPTDLTAITAGARRVRPVWPAIQGSIPPPGS